MRTFLLPGSSSGSKCTVSPGSRAHKVPLAPVHSVAAIVNRSQHNSAVGLPRHAACPAQTHPHGGTTESHGKQQQGQQQQQAQLEPAQQQPLQTQATDGPPASYQAPSAPSQQHPVPAPPEQPGPAQAAADPSDQQPDPAAAAVTAATTPTPCPSDNDTSSSSSAAMEDGTPAPPVNNKYTFFYTHVCNEEPQEPTPVQLPPPQPCMDPVRPFFNKAKYRPPTFLQYYAAPPGSIYNYLSFLGDADPNRGKFLAVGHKLEAFLESYFNTLGRAHRRMYLAECYQGQPFKFYQELDFPWSLDPQLVLRLIPQVVDIVAQEVGRVYADQLPAGAKPQPVLSMRTVYKVHLNFPGITTMEAKAGVVRKAVINRCRAELSGQPPLDKLKAELVLQEHWQEAQAVLMQLQQVTQRLQQGGQEIPDEAQQLLQEHQQLLASAQDASRNAAQSPPPPLPPPPPRPQALQQPQQGSPTEQQQLQTQPQQLSTQEQEQQPPSEEEEEQPPQQQLSLQEQQQQLDWEAIVDFPHGSLRLLGSCKAPWMDSDPEWVAEKAYSRVACVDGVWMRQPLTLASVLECSILLGEGELRVFEQTEEFLEVTYQGVQQREEVMLAKRVKRAAKRQLDAAQALLDQPGQPLPRSKLALKMADKLQRERDKERRREAREEQLAQQAAAKAEQERRKADALARLQAGAARAATPGLTRPALSRPPPLPPPPPVIQPPRS